MTSLTSTFWLQLCTLILGWTNISIAMNCESAGPLTAVTSATLLLTLLILQDSRWI